MNDTLQLERLPLYVVFRMAFVQAELTPKQASTLLGRSESHWYRVLSSEDYYPSAHLFPEICQKLNNTLLIEWMVGKTRDLVMTQTTSVDVADLPLRANDLVGKFAPIAKTVKEVCSDNQLDADERRLVVKAIHPLVAEGITLISDLK